MRRVLLAAVLLLAACENKPPVSLEVDKTMGRREGGLNKKDLALYMSAVSANYGGDATGYTRIEKRAKLLFREIDGITYTSSERQVYEEPDKRLRVVQRYAMELMRGGERISRSGQEQLYLVHEGDSLKIVDGL